ncbi:MAG: hypothetical protein JRI55_39800, partial [Deltaproteobacteria bacterium]|nr:hypothetical protein [Deltaproteobacteria bacterium]
GQLGALRLRARGRFNVRTKATIETGSLPPDLISSGGSIPVALQTAMTARTFLGTVRFGTGRIEPLRSTSKAVPLTTQRLPFSGSLGPDFLQVDVGLPRPRVSGLLTGSARLDSRTMLAVTLHTPLGVPFKVVGGSMTVSSNGEKVGTAQLPSLPGNLGYTVQRRGRSSTTIQVPLVAQHTSVSGTLDQMRALLATTGRGHSRALSLEGHFDVRPVNGGSLGRIRQIPFQLALQPDNFVR